LIKQNEKQGMERTVEQKTQGVDARATGNTKKKFIEPEISVPVDVLEATTFFQGSTSGSTI